MTHKTTSVLIVGAGPIGLALAGDLGFRGQSCILVDKGDGGVYQPKMDMVGIRTMEYCRRWGIVDWVEDAGYNREYTQDCAWVTSLNGHEFGREEFPSPKDEKCPPQSPQHRERCPQNFFDPVLRRFAQKSPSVQISYHTELVDFTETDSGVLATVRDTNTGETTTIAANYLVGTDGGASTVRHKLGIKMEGESVLTYTTNVIFRCEGLENLHNKKPAYRYIFIGPEGTWATLVAINGRDQWRFSLVGDETMQTVTEAEIRKAIVRAVGREFDFEIMSMLPWVRRQLVAESYGTRRVFLAGDSAHLTSPTGGFGMNTGIQDAVNLSWKLAACLEGWGGPCLLESYEIEQRPVAVRNVEESTGNLKRMLNPRITKQPKELFASTPEGEKVRKQFGDDYTEMMKREWFSIGIHLGYVYGNSPIIVPDGTPRPQDTVQTYSPTSRPGSRAPHAWLEPDVSTLDHFGKHFVLLRFGDNAPKGDRLAAAAKERNVPFRIETIKSTEARDLYERELVLVRPDGQSVWRGDQEPDDPLRVIDIVRGASLHGVSD